MFEWGTESHYGYTTTGSRAWTWGTNSVDAKGINLINDKLTPEATTKSFRTDFDDAANEAQVVLYDSGSPAFINNKLAGIALAVGSPWSDCPYNLQTNAIYGAHSYYADLTQYATRIGEITAVPEPLTLSLLAVGAVAIIRKRK